LREQQWILVAMRGTGNLADVGLQGGFGVGQ
jgi:hypothetical protein